jgi:pimeloyl-ACP methyl ester carboxylesterase
VGRLVAGFDPAGHLDRVKRSLAQPANLAAAIGYYRAAGAPGATRTAPQPTLYLHGADDGCIAARLARRAEPFLAPSSRMIVIEGAGHFLQLEKPAEINSRILAWVTS